MEYLIEEVQGNEGISLTRYAELINGQINTLIQNLVNTIIYQNIQALITGITTECE